LKLPWGTYTDVFRLHWLEVDSALSGSSKNTYNSYFWYKRGGGVALLRLLFNTSLDTNRAIYSSWASLAHGGSASVGSQQASEFGPLYPNPALDVIHFGADAEHVRVYNPLGTLMIAVPQPTLELSIASLAPAVYVVEWTIDGKLHREHIVKQ
jgi:hypothetical protein